jgi:DNA-directed RNA polymerase subunit beta'
VPLSLEAQAEARIVMLPSVNLLSPGTGEAITVPSQDMLLGLYVLTLPSHSRTDQNHRYLSHQSLVDSSHLSVPTFSNCHDVLIAHHQGQVHYHSRVWLRWIPTVCLINVISREVPIEFQQQPLSEGGSLSIYEHLQIRSNETQDLIGMYVRTTVGRVLFNQQIEQASASNNWLASSSSTRSIT